MEKRNKCRKEINNFYYKSRFFLRTSYEIMLKLFFALLKVILGQIMFQKKIFKLVLKRQKSRFAIFGTAPGVYEVIDFHITVTASVKAFYVTNNIATKSSFSRSKTLRFFESHFQCFSSFNQKWDYMPGQINFSEEIIFLTPTEKFQLKFSCINDSIVNCMWEHILSSLLIDKLPGYKLF